MSDIYLQNLINNYRVATGVFSLAYIAGNAVSPIIKKWASNQLRNISFSGSYAKGTAIRGRTDIDLFISLKSDTTNTLKDIFDKLHAYMSQNGYPSARKQYVSIHVVHNNIQIDLVPALHFGGNTEDHWLYINKANRERTKTNVSNHINIVQNSGRIDEIVLTKIWRQNHQLDFPSFYLELSVIEALKYNRNMSLAERFWSILRYLAEDFANTRFVDPSNTNNVISDDLTNTEKQMVINQAQLSRSKKEWKDIVW